MSGDLAVGHALLDAGQADRAVEHARRALASDPGSAEAHQLLLAALVEAREFEAAVTASGPALAAAPDIAQVHHLTGIALYSLRKYKQAEQHFQTALQHEPDHAGAHAVLAKTLAHRKNNLDALLHAHRAIELNPTWPFGHRAAGDVAVEAKEWAAAESHYRRALTLDPEDSLSHTNLGFVLAQQGRKEEALDASVNAARLDPTNEVATGNILRMGRAAQAGLGIAIYLVIRLLVPALAVDNRGAQIVLVGIVLAVVGWILWRRHQRIAKLGPVAKQALAAQKRIEGPGSLWLWLMLGWLGCIFGAAMIAGFVDGSPADRGTIVVVAVSAVALAASVVMVLRKLPHYDPRLDIRGPFWVWLVITLLAAWIVVAGIWSVIVDPSEPGAVVMMIGTAGPALLMAGYIAVRKSRPDHS